jgi:hypothetical protein
MAALPLDVRKASGFPASDFFSGDGEAEPRHRNNSFSRSERQSLSAHQEAEPPKGAWCRPQLIN